MNERSVDPIQSVADAVSALAEAQKKVNEAATEIIGMFSQVVDRPSVVRYTAKSFTDRDVNISKCLDPFYYNFPQQAEYTAELIRKGKKSLLELILDKGMIREFGWARMFHPQFIAQVRASILQAILLLSVGEKEVKA